MKNAYVRNNIIERIDPDDSVISSAQWTLAADDAKVGDVFDRKLLSMDEKIALDMPSQKEVVDAMYDVLANNNTVKLEAIKVRVKEIYAKYEAEENNG